MKRKMSMIFVMILAITMVFGGCSGGAANEPSNDSTNEATKDEDSNGYLIGYNNWGQGVEGLDNIQAEAEYIVTSMGNQFQAYNDEFTADKVKTDIQGMISQGCDGIMFFGVIPTLIPVVAKMCEEAKIPFVIFDQIPSDPEMIEELYKNEYYVGSVGTDNIAIGKQMAEEALEDGNKTAIILGGAVGDVIHDDRIAGFTTAFEEGGGKVVGVGHCDSPSDATTKCDDLIAANADADCIYGLTAAYATGAITSLQNYGAEMKVYATDSMSDTCNSIKDGTIAGADGGAQICTTIGALLLQNWLSGNKILDSEGKAPFFNTIVAFLVDETNVDAYQENWLSGHCMSQRQIESYCNEDVGYEDFVSLIENYSLEYILEE